MPYIIQNKYLKATICERGAELQSLINLSHNQEIMWNADPNFWAKHSPVLFPFVGEHKDGFYQYQGQKYHLPRHGFAFKQDFELEKISPEKISFILRSNAETHKIYPFCFELKITYQLKDKRLDCFYELQNTHPSQDMYFSLGAHPGFALPGEYSDYHLHFDQDTELHRWHSHEGLITHHSTKINLDKQKLALNHALFYQDALVLADLKSTCISLHHAQNGQIFKFHFQNYPYFGIWAAKNANFVCLEPWCGIADHENHQGQIEDKLGIIQLLPQKYWAQSWGIEV